MCHSAHALSQLETIMWSKTIYLTLGRGLRLEPCAEGPYASGRNWRIYHWFYRYHSWFLRHGRWTGVDSVCSSSPSATDMLSGRPEHRFPTEGPCTSDHQFGVGDFTRPNTSPIRELHPVTDSQATKGGLPIRSCVALAHNPAR